MYASVFLEVLKRALSNDRMEDDTESRPLQLERDMFVKSKSMKRRRRRTHGADWGLLPVLMLCYAFTR